jgi:hypothetical protein
MKFDHMTLRVVGEILYGPGWPEGIASALDLNLRTVQRWANGQNEIPPWLWPKLAELCPERIREIEKLAAKLLRELE